MTQAAGMPCPVCKVALTMSERQGVEIDYCPQCRGVWLDRGELDKIIERSAREANTVPDRPAPNQAPHQPQSHFQQSYNDQRYFQKKRRKSFLEELFD